MCLILTAAPRSGCCYLPLADGEAGSREFCNLKGEFRLLALKSVFIAKIGKDFFKKKKNKENRKQQNKNLRVTFKQLASERFGDVKSLI